MTSFGTVARFTIRPNGEKDDLILGAIFQQDSGLVSGRIYEIRTVMGELMIDDLGPSAIKSTLKDSNISTCWGQDINSIAYNFPDPLLTEDEVSKIGDDDHD